MCIFLLNVDTDVPHDHGSTVANEPAKCSVRHAKS